MRREETVYANHVLICDDEGNPYAVEINGEIAFRVGDQVYVKDDGYGYICPGISEPGIGKIEIIRQDKDSDHFYGVRMDDGGFGFLKCNRITKV